MWFDHLAEICERRKAGIKKAAATTTTKKSRLTGFHFIYTMDKMITFLNVFKASERRCLCGDLFNDYMIGYDKQGCKLECVK